MNKVEKTTRPLRYALNQIPYNYTVEVTNRFKGLDLIQCLKNFGQRFVILYRRLGSRPSPRKVNAKGQNVLSEEALHSYEKKRSKRQREKEILAQLNAEFQRLARRYKKAFLRDQ